MDLFLVAGEPSGDLHGEKLIQALLKASPSLQIGAVAGPKMRALPITSFFPMENLQVMGFIDVLKALPRLIKQFFAIRNQILSLQPKAVICIDYPGFNLRLEQSLRKKGYKGKLIHYICPTIWAWGKKRIPQMEKTIDLLLSIFPFEVHSFSKTFPIRYIGHPLTEKRDSPQPRKKLLALFPGSREKEIERNLPLQLKIAQRLLQLDPTLQIGVSAPNSEREKQIRKMSPYLLQFIPNHELMNTAHMAIAKSGTVTLELALRNTPTVVMFAIRPLDVWIAQKVFKIDLPFYCIVNIIASKQIFPELFGPHLTEEALFTEGCKLWFDEKARSECQTGCHEVETLLGKKAACDEAAHEIMQLI